MAANVPMRTASNIGPPTPTQSSDSWATLRRFMERACGVVMSDDQRYLMDTRLAAIARASACASVSEYVERACSASASKADTMGLIDAMTTHETFFFRDPPFWKVLQETVIPRLLSQPRLARPLRIWSAACSTGQEPYTVAMLLAESFPDIADRTQIIASDVSEPAVERARSGVYSTLEVNRGLGAARLVRHFEQCSSGFRVRAALRSRVTFEPHNLLSARPDPAGCDIVICRNVLIYFGATDRESVIRRLLHAAVGTGYIGVGSTESLKAPALAPGWYMREQPSQDRPVGAMRLS